MTEIAARKTILLSFPSGTPLHLHVFLTDPIGKEPARVLVVNISSYTNNKQDDTVILEEGEHEFITHKSYVSYDYAKIIHVGVTEELIAKSSMEFKDNVSEELYKKIIKGLLESKRTPGNIKKFCREHIAIEE